MVGKVADLKRSHHSFNRTRQEPSINPAQPPSYDRLQRSIANWRLIPMKRWLKSQQQKCRQWVEWLWRQEGSPAQRARGLAAGIFCGCFPFFGLQTVLGVAFASLIRGNHLLAAFGTWISNPLTYAPLYWLNFSIGNTLLQGGPDSKTLDLSSSNLLEQSWSFIFRILIGSFLVGSFMATTVGFISLSLFRKQSAKKHRIRTGSRKPARLSFKNIHLQDK